MHRQPWFAGPPKPPDEAPPEPMGDPEPDIGDPDPEPEREPDDAPEPTREFDPRRAGFRCHPRRRSDR